jgi:hypothetical protein
VHTTPYAWDVEKNLASKLEGGEVDLGVLLTAIAESGVEEKILKAIENLGPELSAQQRRLRLQLALVRQNDGLPSLQADLLRQPQGTLLARDLLAKRALAVYLVCLDDPEQVLRGLLLELKTLYEILLLLYPEKLRELARLTAEERRSRLAERREEIRRDGSALGPALERLLSAPQQHWQEVPQIFRCMRNLLEAKQEISILTLLGMLPDPDEQG